MDTAFRQGLEALGWIDERNSQVQILWAAGDVELMRTYAAKLIAMGPDVLLGTSTAVAALEADEHHPDHLPSRLRPS